MPEHLVAVVGGGISGLAAARLAAGLQPASDDKGAVEPARVTLFEASPRLGGKITAGSLEGRAIELGPDQFLRRDPSAEHLAGLVGLRGELVAPSVSSAAVYARGGLRRLPTGLVLGVPTDLEALRKSGVLTDDGLRRVGVDEVTDGPHRSLASVGLDPEDLDGSAELSAGQLLRERLGDEAVDTLADPLIGGINAGRIDDLSLGTTAPLIAGALAEVGRLMGPLRSRQQNSSSSGPLFYGIRGGLSLLVEAVEAELERSGVRLRRNTAVKRLTRRPGGFELYSDGEAERFDSVVLAVPAPEAARLISELSKSAARELGGIDHADVALVTLAFGPGELPPTEGLSGFLVPRAAGFLATAATFLSRKWPWMEKGEGELVRVSAGRFGDQRPGELDDEELAFRLAGELGELLSAKAEPLEWVVRRFEGSFPQYRPGHSARIRRLRRELAALSGLEIAGALLGGIGIPACVRSGEQAARRLLGGLA